MRGSLSSPLPLSARVHTGVRPLNMRGGKLSPMKRHKSLYPLSHDHHHALVQARKLRIASSDPDLSSFYQAAGDFIAFWDANLEFHFQQEEEILLPIFATYSFADRPEIVETLKQHLEIRQTLGHLRTEIIQGTATTAEGLQLSGQLERHIRYEENVLFSAIEEAVPEEQLWEINRRLTETKSGSVLNLK